MADTRTGLPVKTLALGDVAAKIVDAAGTNLLAVAADGSVTAVVTATDLDIRNLTHVSDSVQIGDGTDLLTVNADGSINVVVNSTAATPVAFVDDENVVAQNATETVDRIITDTKTFTGGTLKVGSLGACKIKVGAWDGAAYVATKTRTFFQAAGLNPDHDLSWLVHLGDATATVRVAVTNLDNETNVSVAFNGFEI